MFGSCNSTLIKKFSNSFIEYTHNFFLKQPNIKNYRLPYPKQSNERRNNMYLYSFYFNTAFSYYLLAENNPPCVYIFNWILWYFVLMILFLIEIRISINSILIFLFWIFKGYWFWFFKSSISWTYNWTAYQMDRTKTKLFINRGNSVGSLPCNCNPVLQLQLTPLIWIFKIIYNFCRIFLSMHVSNKSFYKLYKQLNKYIWTLNQAIDELLYKLIHAIIYMNLFLSSYTCLWTS